MLTKLFGSNSIFSLVILVLLAIVLWGKMFVAENIFVDYFPVSPFYNVLVTKFSGTIIIFPCITLLLVLFQALFMNNLLVENELLPKKTYMAAFLYLLLTASFSDTVLLHPFIFSGVLLTIALYYLLKLYEKDEGYASVFNIAMLISLSSFFYFPSIIFILFVWVVFIIYRLFAWREWFISILGLALPYVFLGTYYYWNDRLSLKIVEYLNALHFINFHDFSPTTSAYIFIIVVGILLLLAFFKIIIIGGEKPIRIRKLLSVMIWFFVISYLSLALSPEYGLTGFMMLVSSASVLISIYVSGMKSKTRAEVILFIILLLTAFSRFGVLESVKDIF